MSAAADPRFRIGEIARRTGLSPAVLRAWETRYQLLAPVRSAGGTRLYSTTDLDVIRAMQGFIAAGLAPAQAAEAALEARRAADTGHVGVGVDINGGVGVGVEAHRPVRHLPAGDSELQVLSDALTNAMTRLDRSRADAALDLLLGAFALRTLIEVVFLPYLRDVGERWASGQASIAEEHFATNVLRSRLSALSRGGDGPNAGRALLACPPEERHDLPLVILAALLRQQGWQTTLLGADTPIASIHQTAEAIAADAVILSAIRPEPFESEIGGLHSLAMRWPLMLAGAGATTALVTSVGATRLTDPVSAAAALGVR